MLHFAMYKRCYQYMMQAMCTVLLPKSVTLVEKCTELGAPSAPNSVH